MAKSKLAVGLDIGTSSVKLCYLKELKGGRYALHNFSMIPLPPEAIVDGAMMNSTARRVPFTTGLPTRMSGSRPIRSCQSIGASFRSRAGSLFLSCHITCCVSIGNRPSGRRPVPPIDNRRAAS